MFLSEWNPVFFDLIDSNIPFNKVEGDINLRIQQLRRKKIHFLTNILHYLPHISWNDVAFSFQTSIHSSSVCWSHQWNQYCCFSQRSNHFTGNLTKGQTSQNYYTHRYRVPVVRCCGSLCRHIEAQSKCSVVVRVVAINVRCFVTKRGGSSVENVISVDNISRQLLLKACVVNLG